MKRCPECKRDYYDDSLTFCLEDGAPLVQDLHDDRRFNELLKKIGFPD